MNMAEKPPWVAGAGDRFWLPRRGETRVSPLLGSQKKKKSLSAAPSLNLFKLYFANPSLGSHCELVIPLGLRAVRWQRPPGREGAVSAPPAPRALLGRARVWWALLGSSVPLPPFPAARGELGDSRSGCWVPAVLVSLVGTVGLFPFSPPSLDVPIRGVGAREDDGIV